MQQRHHTYEACGRVTVNERVPTQRFHRFVEEEMKNWLEAHELESRPLSACPLSYEVAFFDEDSLGEVSCLIIVNADGNLWRSWETADTLRIALSRSIENLHPERIESLHHQGLETQPIYQ